MGFVQAKWAKSESMDPQENLWCSSAGAFRARNTLDFEQAGHGEVARLSSLLGCLGTDAKGVQPSSEHSRGIKNLWLYGLPLGLLVFDVAPSGRWLIRTMGYVEPCPLCASCESRSIKNNKKGEAPECKTCAKTSKHVQPSFSRGDRQNKACP